MILEYNKAIIIEARPNQNLGAPSIKGLLLFLKPKKGLNLKVKVQPRKGLKYYTNLTLSHEEAIKKLDEVGLNLTEDIPSEGGSLS